jgi:hypothetical protein
LASTGVTENLNISDNKEPAFQGYTSYTSQGMGDYTIIDLVGVFLIFHVTYGMSSFPLAYFSRWLKPPTSYLILGIPVNQEVCHGLAVWNHAQNGETSGCASHAGGLLPPVKHQI